MRKRTSIAMLESVLSLLLLAAAAGRAWAGEGDAGKATEPAGARWAVSLTDGSVLMGTAPPQSLKFRTAYLKAEIPMDQVAGLSMGPDHEKAVVEMRNGDRLTGFVESESLKVVALCGEVKVPFSVIRGVHYVASGDLPYALKRGLVLRYTFDKDEDGKVTDKSGCGNGATVRGAKWTPKGKRGGAYEFDGRESEIESLMNTGIEGAAPRTLAAWVWCDVNSENRDMVPVSFGAPDTPADPYISAPLFSITILHSLDGIRKVGMWGINGDAWCQTPFPTGRWCHVAATYDGKTVRLYLDGKLDGSREITLATRPSHLFLAGMWGNVPGRARFQGELDEVMLYDRALSAEEIKQIYGRAGTASPVKTLTLKLTDDVKMDLVPIRPGSFMMGSEKGTADEKPVHKVTITKPFYIGQYEVTQEQWMAVMDENPSNFKGDKNPVDSVSWDDCQIFLRKLAGKAPGHTFRLPTEAEWEYACRAGTTTAFCYGDDEGGLKEYAWYSGNSGIQPVGGRKPNAWGLYDMHGNACEWCQDWKSEKYKGDEQKDPAGPASGRYRVVRGGTWFNDPAGCRSASRSYYPPEKQRGYSGVGFRVVCVAGAD